MFKIDLKPLKNYPGKTENYFINKDISVLKTNKESLNFEGLLIVEINVTNTEGSFLVVGNIKCHIRLKCSRCLEDFIYPINTQIDEIYRSNYEMNDADSDDVINFNGDTIDITPEIVKSIFMSLPMKAICDSACKGLCQHCGSNLNKENCRCEVEDIDPRLAVLKNFLKD